ncbi:MAG: lipoate--protein ligase family protein [Candidatus Krumholzibacteria bacterium]|nr:lipoate--protein ligase family protein [Candidatus Krumholzibacteria bacterium]
MDRWSFLDSAAAPGAENMALDEMLLEEAALRRAPVLRLYSFDPPAVTIGYHQDPARILDMDAMRADGLDCVRRITGGRALLHEGELTYCVVAPAGAGCLGTDAAGAYLRISEALAAAIRSLGVDAEVTRGRESVGRGSGAAQPCLASTTRYELAVRGRKIAGSAQRKTATAFLQHGSILMRPGSSRIVRYLLGARGSLEDRVTSIEGELARSVDEQALRAAIAGAFLGVFDVEWEPLRLSERDRGEIASRAAEKRREMNACFAGEVCSP